MRGVGLAMGHIVDFFSPPPPPPPPPPPAFAFVVACNAVRSSFERIAARHMDSHVAFLSYISNFLFDVVAAVCKRFWASPTFMVAFVASLVFEFGLRRALGMPNWIFVIERVIDEHLRGQRYVIHQLIAISWLLTGSWSELYGYLRDFLFWHLSYVSWALLVARGCIHTYDSAVASGGLRAAGAALLNTCAPYFLGALSLLVGHMGGIFLSIAVFREGALRLLDRPFTSETSTVALAFELALLAASPLSGLCGIPLVESLLAEFATVFLVLYACSELNRLLGAHGMLDEVKAVRQEARGKMQGLQDKVDALEGSEWADLAGRDRTLQETKASYAKWEEVLERVTALEEQATGQLGRPTWSLLHAAAALLHRHLPRWRVAADGRTPSQAFADDFAQSNEKNKWMVRSLCVLLYPFLSVPIAFAIHGTDQVVWWTCDLLWRALETTFSQALWLWTNLTSLHFVADLLFNLVDAALEWRKAEHSTLILVLLPASVWLGLGLWLRPGYFRQVATEAHAVLTGQGHRSKCLLRMLTRRPVQRHEPQPGDTCPICIDELDNGEPLTFCRWGCGRPIHSACMGQWRSHRNAIGLTECLICKAWM